MPEKNAGAVCPVPGKEGQILDDVWHEELEAFAVFKFANLSSFAEHRPTIPKAFA